MCPLLPPTRPSTSHSRVTIPILHSIHALPLPRTPYLASRILASCTALFISVLSARRSVLRAFLYHHQSPPSSISATHELTSTASRPPSSMLYAYCTRICCLDTCNRGGLHAFSLSLAS
ncbi:hypothetical protein L226DRAFT_155182 [Lentinus tigrinus ALCF2SS1-7]|uniref:uncharacterized protein n=1 Tax=Lentinus tigrinus ALCF2SS1-7 TaxID=1328758 RepID=UPI001165F773|nr:hypothetical protein L226DRAFT_155182 [Lentinus tigrinus ALCF2SS1-7]